MEKKFSLLVPFLFVLQSTLLAQYLEPRFEEEVVNFRIVSNDKYLHHTPGTTYIGQASATTGWDWEEFYLEPTDQANWFRIKHLASGKYLTVVGTNGELVTMQNYGSANADAQKFQFVQQTQSGRYKVHSKYSYNGLALILTIDYNNQPGDHLVYLSPNKTTGDSENQKFDLALLYPDENPASAVASLADRFENRSVGIISNFNGWELLGSTNHSRVYEQAATDGIIADEEWKIEPTNETGWFKIRNKLQNKYITVVSPVHDALIELQTDAAYSDEYQKFKFVVQPDGDNIYKIHSKFSVGPSGARRALVLDVPTTQTIDIRLRKNQLTYADNQKFKLTLDIPPAAAYSNGSSVASGKILGKQYYISNIESLALLEPYVVGNDTLIRVQPNPAYGENAEWTFDMGDKINGIQYYRIRYGKTGQYLCLPSADTNSVPAIGTGLQLKEDNDTVRNRRFQFSVSDAQSANLQFSLSSALGVAFQDGKAISINDDGDLVNAAGGTGYAKNRYFIINLSMPLDGSKVYAIISKAKGHIVSDSSVKLNASTIYHVERADPSCLWHFIPAGDGYYYIRNQLTQYYITTLYSGNAVGTVLKTSSVAPTNDNGKWELIADGNYYHIKNKASGKYFSLYNFPEPGNPIYQGLVSDPGVDWVITRMDYFSNPLVNGVAAESLLSNYNPGINNCLNQPELRDKMIRNIGFPFEPVYGYGLMSSNEKGVVLTTTGIPYSPAPSFYAVVRSALQWKFGWSQLQIDSAISNYNFDKPGHRVQMVYALRNYILEYLGDRPNRNTWTYDEREMVAYLERTIAFLKFQYAERLDASWTYFKRVTHSGNSVGFGALMGFVPDPNDYTEPDYYIADESQTVSLSEFGAISRTFNYKNPGTLATVTVPAVAIAGSMVALTVALRITDAASLASNAVQAAYEGTQLAARFANQSTRMLTEKLLAATALRNAVRVIQSGGGVTAVITVVELAVECLIQAVQDGVEYQNFETALYERINKLRSTPVNINTTAQSSRLLDKFYLCQDFDYVLNNGVRFDAFAPTLDNSSVFVGNGNWSDGAQWRNGRVPLNSANVIINPRDDGECIIDVPLTLTKEKITISPGKTVRILSSVIIQ